MRAPDRPAPGHGSAVGDRRFLISDLVAVLEGYLPESEVREVYRAYLFGAEAHEGQTRLTGEPFIYHPVSVARILADMRLDHRTLIAAILHDVIEDTATAKEELRSCFGDEVAELVDGVSKLEKVDAVSAAEAQAENLRKMLLAMTKDIRVILIKLADRIHNLRTMGPMRPEKRRRIARETLEIYAPIAHRLGINALRVELEDLAFAALYPLRHRVLRESMRRARGSRRQTLGVIETALKRRLAEEGVHGEVKGREKHPWSLYCKMREKRHRFAEVFDVYAFRVVVDAVDACYRVLGLAHGLYKPMPGRFKDYIAIPKANGYQSLHTVLVGPQGAPVELQIRTVDMNRFAESGVAAHWRYKTDDQPLAGARERARHWLQSLLEIQRHAADSTEFLESVKTDLFSDEVYVFTPTGEIRGLPRGATCVDFAYDIHTGVGNTCVAALVERRLVPLSTRLQSGQSVEIVTAPGARPHPAWLGFVATGKARSAIRAQLKRFRRDEAIDFGKRLLEKELDAIGNPATTIATERFAAVLREFGLADVEALYEEVGLGRRLAALIARALAGRQGAVSSLEESGRPREPVAIRGTEGTVVQLARCCRPIPGDVIVGVFSPGRGVVVHQSGCANLRVKAANVRQWFDVQWDAVTGGEFQTELRVEVANRRGVLASVAAAIADEGSNIENLTLEDRDGVTTAMRFILTVRDRRHLARLIRRIRNDRMVLRITRVGG